MASCESWMAYLTYKDGTPITDFEDARWLVNELNSDDEHGWACEENQGEGDFLVSVPQRVANDLDAETLQEFQTETETFILTIQATAR